MLSKAYNYLRLILTMYTYSGPSLICTSSIRPLRLCGLVMTVQRVLLEVCVLLEYLNVFPYKCIGFNYLHFTVI